MENLTDYELKALSNPDNVYQIGIKVAMIAVAIVVLVFSSVSVVAFQRTRHIPKTAKFLSIALLLFDITTSFSFAVRKLVVNAKLNFAIQFFGMGWSFVAYVNVTMMCIERLILFRWPNFYIRNISYSIAVKVSIIIWTVYLVTLNVVVVSCFIIHMEANVFATRICLDRFIIIWISATYVTAAAMSSACLLIILKIILKQKNTIRQRNMNGNGNDLNNSRSVLVVFLCFLNYLITAFIYILMSAVVSDIVVRRLSVDGLVLLNGLIDIFVYILWFKECRLEMLRLFAFLIPRLKTRVEDMRIEVFEISSYVTRRANSNMS